METSHPEEQKGKDETSDGPMEAEGEHLQEKDEKPDLPDTSSSIIDIEDVFIEVHVDYNYIWMNDQGEVTDPPPLPKMNNNQVDNLEQVMVRDKEGNFHRKSIKIGPERQQNFKHVGPFFACGICTHIIIVIQISQRTSSGLRRRRPSVFSFNFRLALRSTRETTSAS